MIDTAAQETTTYKNDDGSWNRSAIMSRSHEIAKALNDSRPYSDRLSEGVSHAWEEARESASPPRVTYESGSLRHLPRSEEDEDKDALELEAGGWDVVIFYDRGKCPWVLTIDTRDRETGLEGDNFRQWAFRTKRRAKEALKYALKMRGHVDTWLRLYHFVSAAVRPREMDFQTRHIAKGKDRRGSDYMEKWREN